MAIIWKYVLVAMLAGGALRCVAVGVRAGAKVRSTGMPEETGLMRIPGLLEDWNETLGYAVLALALLAGAWLMAGTHWGRAVVWNGGAWAPANETVESEPEVEVSEPRESWKANLFWGCVLGLPFGLPAVFMDGKWTAARAFWAAVGLGLFLWMVQSAVENYTRQVRLCSAGLEERTYFGIRRVPWEELGGVEFQDVRAQIERLQDWRTRRRSTLPRMDVWMVKDRQGKEILSLPAEMWPEKDFKGMLERIERRTAGR